ncbi:DUF2730 family protein [Pseudorhizobium xiangyangii]|uniref:DUF2730 family protein n=1 Tax=Pseudorhizobium xiangyangii TaxID=2883104 RepID=UPI001CFF7092|nr:DUF2730 family protein [Neorhizobium xiangyangii]
MALAIIALLGHAKGYFSSGEKTLTARVDKVEGKLVEHDRRVQTVESEMRHLPDKSTAHKLELAMANLLGRLDAMDERMKPIAATSERLHDLLLEQARNK